MCITSFGTKNLFDERLIFDDEENKALIP